MKKGVDSQGIGRRPSAGKTDVPKLLVDYHEGARFLGISYWFFRTLTLKGAWPFIRIGGKKRGNVRVDVRDLEQWLEKNKETGCCL